LTRVEHAVFAQQIRRELNVMHPLAPLLRTFEVDVIVGVDFGAPQRARDQQRKILALAAHSTSWHSYRIDATGINARLLANAPPGSGVNEIVVSAPQGGRSGRAPRWEWRYLAV
jgi:hypothetical protein